jgi:signal peptidase I
VTDDAEAGPAPSATVADARVLDGPYAPATLDPGPNGGDGGDGDGAPAETPGGGKRNPRRALVEWGVLIVAAIVIAIVIKTFLFQAFFIPSESMVPTLEVGDRVLVNKLSYDLHDLHRGDIVVFSAGPNPEWHRAGISDLVKRVIALPGETISECENKQICIDGKLLDESYLPKGVEPSVPWTTTLPYIKVGTRTVLACDASSSLGTCKVPPGEVFVMGDNRSNSQDARANGPIKESSIVGRVFLRIWPPGRIGLM